MVIHLSRHKPSPKYQAHPLNPPIEAEIKGFPMMMGKGLFEAENIDSR